MPMVNLVGTSLKKGQYYLVALAGTGGMADVYRAWDSMRNVYMAVKILRRDLAVNPRFNRMFHAEAENLKRLEHPNIVRLYEFNRENDLVYIVMDWIEGENLRQRLVREKKPIPLEEVSKILLPVCSALMYTHLLNVFHCDIKPANIIQHKDGRVLLADYGVAKHAMDTAWGGTPVYMAPEQFPELADKFPAVVDARTDVYSLGVTLYEVLSGGQVPYRGDTPGSQGSKTRERIAWEIQHNRPLEPLRNINPTIPKAVESVIFSALSKNPAGRFASPMALYQAFNRAVLGLDPVEKSTRSDSSKPTRIDPIQPDLPVPQPPSPVPQPPPPPKGPHLLVRTGELAGQIIHLTHQGLTIGRNRVNSLQLREQSVSRVHARIFKQGFGKGRFYIADQNSLLGVIVNGYRIPVNRAVRLRDRDTIQIGFFSIFEYRET